MFFIRIFILFLFVAGSSVFAEEDLLSIVRKAETLIETKYKDEELSQKYYKSKINKILDSSKDEKTKAAEVKKIISKLKGGSKGKAVVSPKNSSGMLRKSMMIVQGKLGGGSGFITLYDGHKVAVTNIHVIMGNKKIKFLDCYNKRLKVKKAFLAKDRDVVILYLDDNDLRPAIPMEKDVATYKVNTPVVVTGNSHGAGVVTLIKGKLKAVGPKVLEVDAKFVQGNSGSPIISNNKVIGVATFATRGRKDWVSKGTGFDKVRRFGTRIDNLSPDQLQKFNSKLYGRDVYVYKKLKEANETCMKIFFDMKNNKYRLSQTNYMGDDKMMKIAKKWNDAISNPRFGSSYMNTLQDMIKHVEAPAKKAAKRKIHYGFIKAQIDQQLALNKQLLKNLKGFRKNLMNYRNALIRKARGL